MSENIRLSSGIVIDRESKKAYFMAPEGGISAINLQNGETLWHTKNADKPLLIQDNLLVAQAISPENVEGVTIHMLQTDSDGELVNKGLIPVPSGVNPVVSPTLEHSFSISASNSPVGAVLQWTARERPLHGLPPSSNEMLPEERKALESLNIQAPSETAAPTIAAEVALEESESVVGGEVLMSFTDGSVKPIFESSFDKLLPGVPQFSVERYDVSPDASDDESPLYFMSADTRHKILSVAQANEKESLPTYVWEIYENGTENFIGKVRLHVSFSPFVVTGNRLVVELQPYSFVKSGDLIEEPMQIRAFDMQSGKQMWSEKTRDIYDLPDPPH